jgi:stearoyl-CoA desaturase (delta-9 desaturase)
MAEVLTAAQPKGRSYSVPATIFYILLYVGCIGIIWTGVTVEAVMLFAASYGVRILVLSISYHRYYAHRSYRTSRPMQFALALAGATTLEGGPLWWAQTHREHHRKADSPDDLHSPTFQGFLYSHFGWFLNKQHRDTDLAQVPDLAKFAELRWLNRWYLLVAGAYAAVVTALFGLTGFVWGFCLSTVAILQATHFVQTVSHMYGGYRRYPTADNSRNHWWFSILAMGEGFHHNHHYQPSSARLGFYWWEVDVGFQVLRLLQWVGLVRDLKTPSRSIREGALQYQRDLRVFRRNLHQLHDSLHRAVETCRSCEPLPAAHANQLLTDVDDTLTALDREAAELLVAGPARLRDAFASAREQLRIALGKWSTAAADENSSAELTRAFTVAFTAFAQKDRTLYWREDAAQPWLQEALP